MEPDYPRLIHAIQALVYDAEVTIKGNDISGITWLDSRSRPTDKEIQAKLVELRVDYDAKSYQRERQYPPIGDQLDEIYHNGIDEWKKTIKAVKDAHPKP